MFKTKLPLALIALLLPQLAGALGVGEIEVYSKLNEPLRAEIELIYADTEEADSASAQLASAEDFERIGLEPSTAAAALMFDVARNAQGNYVIKVTTLRPVTETFLDFLMEVEWANGRLLREYVVLLDPPVSAPGTAEVSPLPESATAAAPTRDAGRARAGRGMALAGGDYGPIQRGETLWEIARDASAGSGADINQMMLAIFRANPEAFYQDNINALSAGAILRIPADDEATAVGPSQALAEVAAQNSAWGGFVQRVAPESVPTVSDAGMDQEFGTTPAAARADEADSRLELVPPGESRSSADRPGSAADEARMAETREELARVREELIIARQENTELSGRVTELEDLIGSMEQALSLKDAELADLEDQMRQARALRDELGEMGEPGGMGAEEAPADLSAAPGPETEAESAVPEDLAATEGAPEVGAEAAFEDGAGPSEPLAGEEPAAGPAASSEPVATSTPEEPAPAPPATRPDEGLPAWVLPVAGGGALLLLAGGVLAWVRRRGEAGAGAGMAELAEEYRPDEPAGGEPAAAAASTLPSLEEGPTSEAAEDEDALLARLEDDPEDAQAHLALLRAYHAAGEEDKFLAAAERMHAQVGDTHPAWIEVRSLGAALLPAAALFGGPDTGADEPFPEGDATGPDVDTKEFPVPDMEADSADGSDEDVELDFDLGLDDLGDADEDVSLDFDLDELEPEPGSEATAAAAEDDDEDLDLDLDFDLGLEESPEEASATDDALAPGSEPEAAAELEDELPTADAAPDLADSVEAPAAGLDDVSAGLPETPEVPAEPREDEEDADAPLEFDLSDFELPEAPAEASSGGEEAAEEDIDLDLDLESLGVDLEESTGEHEAVGPEAEESPGDATEFELEAVDLSEGTDLGGDRADMDTAEMALELPGEAEGGEVDLGDLELPEGEAASSEESAGTKLDLARAYIEMGDPDGARGMLEEVLGEGSEAQRDEARKLLDDIGS